MRENLALIIAAPLVLVGLAVALDSRLRRGYALGLFAAGALVLDVWGLIRFFQVAQFLNASHTDNLDVALILAVYLLIGLYIALVLTLGAIAETVIARQWRWLAIIAIVSFVPAGISLAPAMGLVPDVFVALGLSRGDEVVMLLMLPALITFAYAVARSIARPVAL